MSTILLITRDRLVRADFRSGREPRLLELVQEFTPAVDDFPSLVEAALRLSKRRPGRVWVLSTEVWTQTLTLTAQSASGLGPVELAKALAFEAEPFSGISGLEAAGACVELPGDRNQRAYWLVELPSGQLEQVDYVIRAAGGRLAGVGHPAGLTQKLALSALDDSAASGGDSWTRVELWPGAIVCLRGESNRVSRLHVVNTEPKAGRWQSEVERWCGGIADATHRESLLATATIASDEVDDQSRFSLDTRSDLEAFLLAWAEQLDGKHLAVPLVPPPKRPASPAVRRAAMAVLGLAALVLCIAHYLWTEKVNGELAAEIVQLKQPVEEFNRLKKDLEAEEKKKSTLQAECDKLAADLAIFQQVRSSLRQRAAKLLTVLAENSSDQMMIRRIEATGSGAVIHGVCLDPQDADALFGGLARSLEPLGWRVQLPRKHGQDLLVGGGPWQFQLHIEEMSP
ncbi:MAG: hypothetical protein KJ000_31590 [Pirellulaceae bacterium]|nr:hypothetical protein [Pirellulaceae bacterium]